MEIMDGEIGLIIRNKSFFVLPATGGKHSGIITLGGWLLMLLAVALFRRSRHAKGVSRSGSAARG